jgi:mannose-6-phosphate isomerase-like protein (cupin superfamily)
MDLTSDLRELDKKLYKLKGSETNANLYLSHGSQVNRSSFDPHNHDYHVIVKPIYGSCIWEVNGRRQTVDPDGIIILPAGTMHAVVENKEPRLSLTINMSG